MGKAVSKCANGFSANSLAARTTEAMHLGLLDHVGSRGLILLTSFECRCGGAHLSRQKLIKALHPGRVGTGGDGCGFQPSILSKFKSVSPNISARTNSAVSSWARTHWFTAERPLETLVATCCSWLLCRKANSPPWPFSCFVFSLL